MILGERMRMEGFAGFCPERYQELACYCWPVTRGCSGHRPIGNENQDGNQQNQVPLKPPLHKQYHLLSISNMMFT